MAIRILTGKPGGGKSYYALRDIIDELAWGTRTIVTNLPLDLGALNAYLQANYKDQVIDLHARVRMLSEDECKFFFAHREQGVDFHIPTEQETKNGVRIDYGDIAALKPVMYVIDEAHLMFDARAWMTSGPHLTFYNSQHRKPGDEVWFITQFVALLDKRCSGFAQEFINVRNYGLERLALFRGPKGQHGAESSLTSGGTVTYRLMFRLDLKIAACYATTAGVGMSGRSAKPREKEAKGLAPGYAVAAVALIVTGIWFLPDVIAGTLSAGSDKIAHVTEAADKRFVPGQKGIPSKQDRASYPSGDRRQHEQGDGFDGLPMSDATWEAVTVVGYVLDSTGSPVVWLSDGRELRAADLESINRNDVKLKDGTSYRLRRSRVVPALAAARS